jgi:hypothetical protein
VAQRHGLSGSYGKRTGYASAHRPGDERIGEPAGSYSRPGAWGSEAAVRGAGRDHVHRGTGPHRGKGPAGYQRSDERIRELVCEALTDDGEIDATRIEVSVKGGEVTLTGAIEDRRMKRLAEDCVEAVPGVKDVHNQLRIGEPPIGADRSGQAADTAGDRPDRTAEPPDKKHRPS